MDDPKDEFDQLHPIKMLFLNALVSEGRPTETRHMPRWWNLEFVSVNGIFLITKCEKSLKINNFDWWFSTHTQGSTDHQPRGRLNRTEPFGPGPLLIKNRIILKSVLKWTNALYLNYLRKILLENFAENLWWKMMKFFYEIFYENSTKKTKQSKFQSTK